jgi:hypothetical protein
MSRLLLSSVVCIPSLFAAAVLADAPLRINEIRSEQPGADLDEYIEIAGAPGESLAGVSLVIIGDDDFALPGTQNGYVEEVVPLSGTIPASGFFVIGEPSLSLAIPNLAVSLNLEGNDNVTYILVRGFTGNPGQKLDTNDDGVLDLTPWTSIVSSVALIQSAPANGSTSDWFYSASTVGPDGALAPSQVWLCANTPTWVIGTVDPLDTGARDTPGAANATCVPTGVIISEVRTDQVGTDNDEFFELKGAPGTLLDGYTFITIGDGTAVQGSGVIEVVVSLAGRTIQADGFLSIAESSWTGVFGSADVVLPATPANPLNFENTDNLTHLLVRNFTGTNGQDLDTNDDGVLDITPWTEISDSVAMVLTAGSAPAVGTEWWYSANKVGPDGTFAPGNVHRCQPTLSWQIGNFGTTGTPVDSAGGPNANCTTCGPGAGNCHAVHATPGCVDTTCCNLVCVADPTCCSQDWDQACVNQARASCLASGTAPVVAFNEIRINEPNAANPNEYIEITGTPGASLNGVSILVIGDAASPNGVIEAVISLNGTTIPKDGIMLIAESTFTLGTPDAVRSMNLENGDTVTYMLVFNFTGLVNTDIDTNDDCTLDSTPWDSLIDSVAVLAGDGLCAYSTVSVGPDYVGQPGHVVKCSDGSWRFGRFDPAAVDGFGTPGTANLVCPPAYACGNPKAGDCYLEHANPGCGDQTCCDAICRIDVHCCETSWDGLCVNQATLQCFTPATPPVVKFSEIRIDENSLLPDPNEYFELAAIPQTLLNGVYYIIIGDGSAALGSGVIECVIDLRGNRVPNDGFFLGAKSTFALAGGPADFVTTAILFENSDNVTHKLVFGFTGAIGDDLDTNDDGVLDVTPWSAELDSVAFVESAVIPPVGTEYAYGDVRVGPDPTGFVPSQLSYCPSSQIWTIGPFDVANAPGFDSPGAANPGCDYTNPCPEDLDGDGTVGSADLTILLSSWGSNNAQADIDNDGVVGSADLTAVLSAWGPC